MRQVKVASVVGSDYSWDVSRFNLVLLEEVVDRIMIIPPPRVDDEKDVLAWKYAANGLFYVKSTYISLILGNTCNKEGIWKRIWRWDGLPKVRTFIWLLSHNSLITRKFFVDRNIANNAQCPFICGHDESFLHCLRDCDVAKRVWKLYVNEFLWDEFFLMTQDNWLHQNCFNNWGKEDRPDIAWFTIFAYIVWNIWINRCAVTFGKQSKLVEEICYVCDMNIQEYVSCRNKKGVGTVRKEILIGWNYPDPGWLSFNMDVHDGIMETLLLVGC